ncbi:MAG: polysaccharide deacetylase family protein [Limnochordales bacterium]|nr:polysaccharide deacetylase family protein [Limnochordales bacterium]
MYILRFRWAILALVLLVGGAFGGGWAAGALWPRAVPVSLDLPVSRGLDMPVFYVRTDQPLVALTFDISWGRQTAGPVLDILKEKGVRATFFLTGFWAKKQRDIAQRIVADGHEIASHGDDHVNLSRYDGDAIAKNIMTAHRDLEEATGRQARFFRPPNGDYDDLVVATARQLGYETVIWSLDTLDWKNPGADYMVRRVLNNVHPGDIILMHASDSSRQIHLALPRIIDGLRAQGYQLMTLGELMAAGTPARDDPRGRPRR